MAVNTSYAKSASGIFKLCICVVLIITLICACVVCTSYRIFLLLVSIFGFLIEFAFYLFYLLSLTGKISINWPLVDFITSIVMIALSIICFSVACHGAHLGYSQDAGASFFWLLLLILLCVDCYFSFRAWKGGSHGPAGTTNVGPAFVSEPAASNMPSYQSYPPNTTRDDNLYSN